MGGESAGTHRRGQIIFPVKARRGKDREAGVPSCMLGPSLSVSALDTQIFLFCCWPCFGNIIFPLSKSNIHLLSHLESGCRCCLRPSPKSSGSLLKIQGQLRHRTEASQVADCGSVGVYR